MMLKACSVLGETISRCKYSDRPNPSSAKGPITTKKKFHSPSGVKLPVCLGLTYPHFFFFLFLCAIHIYTYVCTRSSWEECLLTTDLSALVLAFLITFYVLPYFSVILSLQILSIRCYIFIFTWRHLSLIFFCPLYSCRFIPLRAHDNLYVHCAKI